MISSLSSAPAQTIDPHLLYEQNCAGCHAPHARDFVHDNLIRAGDKIIARQSRHSLQAIFEAGHGRLTRPEMAIIISHLTAIQRSGRLFHDKCLICHDRAVILARTRLALKNGTLVGRYSNRNIEKFLLGHGRLKGSELAIMLNVLKRQLAGSQK